MTDEKKPITIERLRDMYSWATGWKPDVDPETPHMADVQAGLRDEFDAALAAHVAEKRAEWEAEQGEAMAGRIVTASFEDGKDHGIICGLEGCECPDHEGPVVPAGTYITIRLDEDCSIGLWPVRIQRLPVPDTTNTESEDAK